MDEQAHLEGEIGPLSAVSSGTGTERGHPEVGEPAWQLPVGHGSDLTGLRAIGEPFHEGSWTE